MKNSIITISALSAFFAPAFSYAGSFEDHFGGQEGVNAHFQGTDHRLEDRIDHLQRSDTNNNAWDVRQQEQIDNNTAWNDRQEGALRGMQGDIKANAEWDDRQEGVIRQNRGRLDENDARNQRQDASIDNAHARVGGVIEQADRDRAVINGNTERSIGNQQAIGFLQETDAQLSSAIRETNGQLSITDKRSINNAERLDGAEGAIRETNTQVTADRKASVQRDTRIESESIQRDTVIANQVDYNEQVNAAYRRQSAAQFEQHGAAIQSNTQAIADERDARQAADRDLQAGIAAAIASGSHIMDANYQGLQVSIAGGAYRGASAASLALGGSLNSSTFAHINVSHDSRGNQAVGGNVNWKF